MTSIQEIQKHQTAINFGKEYVSKNPKFLTPTEVEYASEFYPYAQTLLDNRQIFDLEKLKKQKWNKFPVRYGINSIIGFNNEIWACVTYNKYHKIGVFPDKCHLTPSNKKEQISGGDLRFVKPEWSRAFIGQCKTTHIENGYFKIRDAWFNYPIDGDNGIDRLIMADYTQNKGFCVDYPVFKRSVEPLLKGHEYTTMKIADLIKFKKQLILKIL